MRLLIVDNHFGVRALIRSLVTSPADEVRECASGEEAIRVAQEFIPDLITMDVRLRGVDGIAVTRVLREACPRAHVVIVTSFDQPALRAEAVAAGATDFVAKDNLIGLQRIFVQLAALVAREARSPKSEETR